MRRDARGGREPRSARARARVEGGELTDPGPGRFDGRADAYERARPGYPADFVARLCAGLRPEHAIADVGAGTGKLTVELVGRFARVVALEPSESMRGVLARLPVEVRPGTAEATGLPDGDVDAIVAAQAFHWFDVDRTCAEWSRVLRGPRAALLVWNDRRDDTPFGAALAALLDRFQTERRDGLGHFGAARDAKLTRFAAAGARLRDTVRTRHAISLDHEALVAWCGSVSYLPRPGAPSHASMISVLDEAFAQHQEGGVVKLDFEAVGYCYALPTGERESR